MFRFTIRELLWLMLTFGFGVGWYLNSYELPKLRNEVDVLANKLALQKIEHELTLRAYHAEIERVSGRKLGAIFLGSPNFKNATVEFNYADNPTTPPAGK